MDWLADDATLSALIGAAGGLLLGLAARLGRFCTLGAIEDALYGGSTLRARMWALAIGVAITGSFALMAADLLPAQDSFYLSQAFSPIAAILGGLAFGYGMAMTGTCGYGAIARLGGGDLRSFVIVLVMGVSAYVLISGPLASLRVILLPPSESDTPAGIAHGLQSLLGWHAPTVGMIIGLAIIAISLSNKALVQNPKSLFWASCVGLAVILGWAGTAWIATSGFGGEPIVSHTFSAPVGDTILFAMLSSGLGLSFGVGSVAGVWVGAFIGSLIKGHFRWEACEDPRELRRQIMGAVIMGAGAVIAGGCTIGQGVSAFSLLAYSAPLTVLAIIAGAALGLRQLIEGFGAPAE